MLELNLQKFQTALQVCKEKEQIYQQILQQVRDAVDAIPSLPEPAGAPAAELRGVVASLTTSAEVLPRFLAVLEAVDEAARHAKKREALLTESGLTVNSIDMRCVSLEHLRQYMTDIRFRDGGTINE